MELMERSLPRLARKRQKMTELAHGRQVRSYEARNGNAGPRLQYKLGDLVQVRKCARQGPGSSRNLPSQRGYLDPREIIDLAFFQDRTASEDEELAIEEEEEEETVEEDDEEETPEEGSYSEHSEGEQSEAAEEEEEEELELEESEWEISADEAEQTDAQAEDPEVARKREEIEGGKRQLDFASGTNLQIADDPTRDPEPPKPEDGDPAAET
ncbi:hypothetical protein CBR_g28741 [Chara braunii]|uniref:Uncharacterized protein n=1 Tax=Chara braunii TaxID=69332 RepID=A0A388L9R6_CHABU|nr:hypothetical protein CBR_g28741 [Chara braunii]|eukprot:GBG79028.1 hypothetical protein CBR_g28741 [Chara braunii]